MSKQTAVFEIAMPGTRHYGRLVASSGADGLLEYQFALPNGIAASLSYIPGNVHKDRLPIFADKDGAWVDSVLSVLQESATLGRTETNFL